MLRSELIDIKDAEMDNTITPEQFTFIYSTPEQSADAIRGQSANYLICDDKVWIEPSPTGSLGYVPMVRHPCTTGTYDYAGYQEMFRRYYEPYKRDDSNCLFKNEDIERATLKGVTFDKELPPGHYHVEELPPGSGGPQQFFTISRNCLDGIYLENGGCYIDEKRISQCEF